MFLSNLKKIETKFKQNYKEKISNFIASIKLSILTEYGVLNVCGYIKSLLPLVGCTSFLHLMKKDHYIVSRHIVQIYLHDALPAFN